MNIVSIRYGLSCNSSSTYTMLIVNQSESYLNSLTKLGLPSRYYFNVLSDENKKIEYLAVSLYGHLRTMKSDLDMVKNGELLVNSIIGTEYKYLENIWEDPDPDFRLFTMPLNSRTRKIDEMFLLEFKECLEKDMIRLIGINDDNLHAAYAHILSLCLDKNLLNLTHTLHRPNPVYIKKDFNVWTAMNKYNPCKIKFVLNDTPAVPKGETPDLVDIKITKACKYNCPTCYELVEPSDPIEHPGMQIITERFMNLCVALKEMGVLEVALAGGDLSEIPIDKLKWMIYSAKESVPFVNTTIRPKNFNTNLGLDEEFIDILMLFDSIAFSIDISDRNSRHAYNQIKAVEAFSKRYHLYPRVYYNIIIDSVWTSKSKKSVSLPKISFLRNLTKLLDPECFELRHFIFLAFKQRQRAANIKVIKRNLSWNHLSSLFNPDTLISIDSLLAERYPDITKNIPEEFIPQREGAYNMYIDLVDMFAAPSSYCDEKVPLDGDNLSANRLKEIFAEF